MMTVMTLLLGWTGPSGFFHKDFEHVMRVEFQGRGTLHIHIALWVLLFAFKDLRGKTGDPQGSPLVEWLEEIGFKSVDVQYGDGFLNY